MFKLPTSLRLVLVEDSDEDADTVTQALKRSGIPVELQWVTSGDACMALLAPGARHPVMVLLDLNTPGIDGRETLKLIKASAGLKAIPVVILSTSASAYDRDYCYSAGANAYHVKPVRYPDHLQLVETMLHYWFGQVALPTTMAGKC